jgi:DNA-binding transcriptional LysR family regulator
MARQQISNLGTMLDSIREVSEKRFGKIWVTSLPTMVDRLFPQLLGTYALSHPNIGVQIFDENNDFVARQVQAGIAEFGVGMDPGAEGDLTFTPLLFEEYVLAVHRADPMAARDRVTLQELGDAKLIIGGDSGNRLLLEVLLGNAGVSLRWFYEVEHVSCLLDLMDTGIGCAIVAVLTLSQRHDQNIRKVHIDGIDVRRTLGIVRHRSLSISPLVAEFMEMLAGNIKNI